MFSGGKGRDSEPLLGGHRNEFMVILLVMFHSLTQVISSAVSAHAI